MSPNKLKQLTAIFFYSLMIAQLNRLIKMQRWLLTKKYYLFELRERSTFKSLRPLYDKNYFAKVPALIDWLQSYEEKEIFEG
jgi:hypothetical protein